METIETMNTSVTAAELCKFVHCCRSMSTSIPDMPRNMQPLNDILERASVVTVRRRKSASKHIALQTWSWGAIWDEALLAIQRCLTHLVKLAFSKKGHEQCVLTDASETFWAGILTETKLNQLHQKVSKQEHEPLLFFRGQIRMHKRIRKTWKWNLRNSTTFERTGDFFFGTTTRSYFHRPPKSLLWFRATSPAFQLRKTFIVKGTTMGDKPATFWVCERSHKGSKQHFHRRVNRMVQKI